MKPTLLLLLLISGLYSQAQITDVDGNSYDTVRIGTQTWMAENLNVSRFRNGDTIPEAKSDEEWLRAGENQQPAWCYYQNDPKNGNVYGKIYNWYAVNDSRGLGPEAWHVATELEWTVLTDYLGGDSIAGATLKSTSGWLENGSSTNESGFLGLPGGCRSHVGSYYGIGEFGFYWNIPDGYSSLSWSSYLYYGNGSLYVGFYNIGRGFSVRCVKN
jgi:uncharacterized protein (TIGR02145 family)